MVELTRAILSGAHPSAGTGSGWLPVEVYDSALATALARSGPLPRASHHHPAFGGDPRSEVQRWPTLVEPSVCSRSAVEAAKILGRIPLQGIIC